MSSMNVHQYFNKSYEFKNNEAWELPKGAYSGEKWSIESFQRQKTLLNSVKEQLNDVDLEAWSQHTKWRDPSSSIIKKIRHSYKPELLTQAWCKFYEIISKHDLISSLKTGTNCLRSLHLCEAPGGFVSALNHYLRLHRPDVKLDWRASTLNPEYEGNPLSRMIPDDRLIRHTKKKWLFGADYTGDITQFYNHKFIINEYNGKADLITADGSVNCIDDPGDQERKVEHIHYCEVMTAFPLLRKGGNFVLKIFTTFEDSTICLLYLLNCTFETVTIFKPITSKSGNSEVYVICKNYHGFPRLAPLFPQLLTPYKNRARNDTSSMFKLSDINELFLKQLDLCSEYFMCKQTSTINENLKHFQNDCASEKNRLRILHAEITNTFLNRYHLREIHTTEKLVPDYNITHFSYKAQNEFEFEQIYYPKEEALELRVVTGKRVQKLFYSKHCKAEEFELSTCLERLLLSANLSGKLNENCDIIDVTDFKTEDHSTFQKRVFTRVRQITHTSSAALLLRIPFLSNFLVGILYLLCGKFERVHFFNNGSVYLMNPRAEKGDHCAKLLREVADAFANIENTADRFEFQMDIVEVIDTDAINPHFLKAVWFYNNHLLSGCN